ncbi:MAG: ankyrin repeat domain-containing protein [Treponema sp.]|jgi:ankyrin repeat protein|nr:ankyrin repeat domain-containing protein [Treponema sp.]
MGIFRVHGKYTAVFGILVGIMLTTGTGCTTLPSGAPPLHEAIASGNFARVQKLVESGADVNEQYGGIGIYPLERAAEFPEIALYLLSKGAGGRDRAFSAALDKSQYDLARALVDAGVNCNENANAFYYLFSKKDLTVDQKIKTAKDVSNNTLTSPYILVHIAPEDYKAVVDAFNINLEAKVLDADALGNVIDLGSTVLHVAARRNNADLIQFLLETGVDVNALDNNRQTALFYAITAYGPRIDWESPIIENETTAKINFAGDMPYYSNAGQVQQRQVANVLALLDANSNINQQNYAGWAVLHFAAAAYPEGLRELLVEHGADTNLKTNMNRTAEDILQLRGNK